MVIFLDDKEENILSVEKYCQKNSIEYLGIHYTAALDNTKKITDDSIARFQIKNLYNKETWLSDHEAKSKIDAELLETSLAKKSSGFTLNKNSKYV